jgi:hypothetical protein
MRAGWVGRAGWALVAAVCAGCVHDDNANISYIGSPRPARGANCELQVFFSTKPLYPVTEIASTRVQCSHYSGGREGCVSLIKKQACEAGADTVFGFEEAVRVPVGMFVTPTNQTTFMTATFAVRAAGVVAAAPTASGVAADGSCNPICSPGFACAAGQCIAQCNPPCEAGEVCSRKRVCEPAGATPQPVAAAPYAPPPAARPQPQPQPQPQPASLPPMPPPPSKRPPPARPAAPAPNPFPAE